jgi:rhodanese-related sulfurtransferase
MAVEDLSPTALLERRESGELWLLLDVREVWERDIAKVAEALHIPMGEIPERHVELNAEQPIAVICHSGGRSARVAAFLSQQGFRTLANVRGGIDAWAVEVDTSLARY